MFLVISLFAMFASIFTLSKIGLLYAEPFFFIGSRMAVAGIILLIYQAIKNKSVQISWKHLGILAYYGVLAMYITNIAEIWGIDNMISAKACLIYSLTPFFSALIAYVVLKETLNTKKWFGMLIGFIGLIPITFTQTDLELTAGSVALFSMAELAIVIAVIASVYGWVLLKQIMSKHNYSFITINGTGMAVGGTLALLHSYFAGEHWTPIPVSNYSEFSKYVLLMCLISNIICYNLYGYLLKRYSATFMAFAGLVTPIFASLFGWLALNEQITWHFFVSIALFTAGLFIFHQEELKH